MELSLIKEMESGSWNLPDERDGIGVGGEIVGGRRGVDAFAAAVEDEGVAFGHESLASVLMHRRF